MAFLSNIPYIRIAGHRIVIFNVLFLVVIDFMIVKLSFKARLHERFLWRFFLF